MLRSDFTKGHKEFVIDCTCVVQDTSNDFLGAFDAIGMQYWNWFSLSCIPSLGPIINLNMLMR